MPASLPSSWSVGLLASFSLIALGVSRSALQRTPSEHTHVTFSPEIDINIYPSSSSSPVSKAKIMSNREIYIKSGNDINLTCVTMQAPSPPLFIYWYKNGNIINYAQRGGINIITERQSKTSKLIIDRATAKDSGNYTCSPSDSGE